MIEDVSRQITLVNAKLASLAQTPGMGAEIQKLQNEVTQISAKMGDLLSKPNKDINKEDIKKAATRLAEIPGEADKIAEKMLKEDSTNKEASSILVQALALVQDAIDKEKKYLQKKEQAIQREEENISKAREEKIKVRISTDRIDYDADNTKSVNPEVKKFQELVVDKFGKINKISSLPQFKMMGTDGKFGKGTRDMVKILKKGFDLSDTSGDITKELLDEIQVQSDSIKESVNSRVYTFSDFLNVSEAAFNVDSATDYAKSLATYSTPSPSGKSSGYGKVSSGKIFKQGDKGPEVTAIQNAVSAKVTGTDEDKNQLFGPVTKQAVMDWQKANGFTGKDVDGIVGPNTLKKMAEMKSLGTWTASMISKLANVEVKALSKSEESKVLSDAEKKEVQEAAVKIVDSVQAAGTDEDGLLIGIRKIKNKKQFDAVNSIFAETHGKDNKTAKEKGLRYAPESVFSSIEAIINNELGWDEIETVKEIADYLKSIGVNATFATEERGSKGNIYFKENSFKIS
jgi:peptidoglycan hydrolase-like protein with peptidoglycan-binding domain